MKDWEADYLLLLGLADQLKESHTPEQWATMFSIPLPFLGRD